MSQEVSGGRTSMSVVYGRVQAASGRSVRIEWPVDRVGGQGTWPARFRVATLGRATWTQDQHTLQPNARLFSRLRLAAELTRAQHLISVARH
jgi:hypothetical protein